MFPHRPLPASTPFAFLGGKHLLSPFSHLSFLPKDIFQMTSLESFASV